jgi:hypothetical protein
MLRIPHCLDNRLRDGSKVVTPTRYKQIATRSEFLWDVLHCWEKQYWILLNKHKNLRHHWLLWNESSCATTFGSVTIHFWSCTPCISHTACTSIICIFTNVYLQSNLFDFPQVTRVVKVKTLLFTHVHGVSDKLHASAALSWHAFKLRQGEPHGRSARGGK